MDAASRPVSVLLLKVTTIKSVGLGVSVPPACCLLNFGGKRNFRVTTEGDMGEAGAHAQGPHLSAAACLKSVLAVLLVCRVVWGQRRSVDAGMVKSTVVLIPAAALHHEVATQRPFGHVWKREDTKPCQTASTQSGEDIRRPCSVSVKTRGVKSHSSGGEELRKTANQSSAVVGHQRPQAKEASGRHEWRRHRFREAGGKVDLPGSKTTTGANIR